MSSILPEEDIPSNTEDISEKLLNWWALGSAAFLNFWWIIVLCVTLGIAFQVYMHSKEKPSYYSNAELIMTGRMIAQEKVGFQEFEMLETQVAMLTSNRLKQRASQRMKVFHPEISASWVAISSYIREGTTIYVVEARGGAPEYTQKFLQALVQEYLQLRQEMRTQTSNDVLVSRTNQLQKVEEEIEELEATLVAFQRQNNLMFIQEKSSSAGREMASIQNQIVQLQTNLRMLQTLPLEQVLVEITSTNLSDQTTSFINSNRYLSTKEKIINLEAALEEFSIYLTPKHPKRIQIESNLAEQRMLLEIHKKSVQEEIDQLESFLLIKIKNLQKVAQEWQNSALDMSSLNAEHDRILSKLDRTRTLYNNLVNTIQSIDLNAGEAQNRIEIHEEASTPSEQRPSIAKAVLTGGMMGISGSISILVLIALLDNRLTRLDDFNKYPEIPALAAFPQDENLTRNNLIENLNATSKSSIYNGFHDLQTSFFLEKDFQKSPRTFLVTSSTPDEGKSTTSTALAMILARNGAKTILIDSDIHRGKLHTVFNTPHYPGFTNYLENEEIDIKELIKTTSIPHLSFLPSGLYVKDSGPALRSAKVGSLLSELKKSFDYIILDTPPITASGDAVILSEYADHLIFCARAKKTSHRQIRYCFNKLSALKEKVSGLVLTFAKKKNSNYYDYYDSY